MEGLLLILGAAGFAWLWNRMNQLEVTVAALREQLDWTSRPQLDQRPEQKPVGPVQQAPPSPATRQEASPEPQPIPAAHAPTSTSTPEQQAEPAPVPAEDSPADWTEPKATHSLFNLSFNFEEVFGRLLPIWAGGITLAVAGFFLVRWSIEQGLLTPSVRVTLGFLFGLGLLAGAEAARRMARRITDPRVAQALAGAGLATLYASFYLAGSGYGLVGSTIAFIGLAAVTAGAIALSWRFGLPSAVLGLVGGFAAPVLAGGSEANVPLLATYLGFVTAGLALTGERQKRAWMGIVALFFGLGWGALLLLDGPGSTADAVAIGGYLVLLGVVVPALATKAFSNAILRLVAGALATLQMAILVAQDEFGFLAWSLFVLLSAALAYLGWREARLREGSAIAATTGVWLLIQWPEPQASLLAVVGALLTAIFAGVPLAILWRREGCLVDHAMVCAVPLAVLGAVYWQFGEPGLEAREYMLAIVAAALALFPAIASRLAWPETKERMPARALAPLSFTAILFTAAALLALPWWFVPVVGLAAIAALVLLLHGFDQESASGPVWGFTAFTLVGLFAGPQIVEEFLRLFGSEESPDIIRAILRWSAAAVGLTLVAWHETNSLRARAVEALAALLAYGTLAQLLPADMLAWSAAAGAIAAAWLLPRRNAVVGALVLVAALWALAPLREWLSTGMLGLSGDPVLVADLPGLRDVALYLLPFAAASGALGWRQAGGGRTAWGNAALFSLPILGIALHVLYKQVFAIESASEFTALGLAERTVWQAALAGTAIALLQWRSEARSAAFCLAAAALLHFGWFTLVLHNPLWSVQEVGHWPLANWLLPAYGTAILLLIALRTPLAELFAALRPLIDAAIMALISLLALSLLRHGFAGTVLVATDVGQTEDLLRSLLGIVLAAGFLVWGARTGERSWRIGSLILMLLAVVKVFLFDAAGLEGLARIASFMALGFSLIGIGWFYNRQLRGGEPERVEG